MNALLGLCLLLLVWRASADCQLTAEIIGGTNRIFAYQIDEQWELLRHDVVKTGQTLGMICSASDVVPIICQPKGNFEPLRPMTDCKNPIKPSVEVVADNSCLYSMYRVGYRVNYEQFLELYRSCYDVPKQTAHFVIHSSYPNSLTSRPLQAFTMNRVISGAKAASFQAKNIYARFNELLGSGQTYVKSEKDLVFDRGHLAPSGDFGFEPYTRQSFMYLNVVAMFRGINRSNWKSIENWVRRVLSDNPYQALHICTGGFGVLELPHSQSHKLKKIYLIATEGNPVPKWLYKIVSDGTGSRYAFLTYNNVHDEVEPVPNCQQIAFPATLTPLKTKKAGYTFCCDADDFISRNLPRLEKVC